tara:strand:- start:1417 stop:2181 length:765 start_codon:yes stop_codon:yes gene_type:complete
MAMTVDLSGKTALVTGASSGIGAGVAVALAANGAHVFVNYPRPEERANAAAVVEEIVASGGVGYLVEADVSNEAQVLSMFEQIQAVTPSLGIMVNNAGVAHSSVVEDMQLADFERLMAVHVTGTFLCTRAALRVFYQQNYGRLINTASQLAYLGAPGFAHYTAAKGAILSFTRSVALEIGDRNITANCVAPGATKTPILDGVPDEILEAIRSNIPAGRLAEVEDIVGAYMFLASDEARHFRGQCLSPNGGDAFL